MMPSPPHSAANVNLLHRRAPRPGVLVVDDEDAIRSSIAMLLEDEGYTVLQASNGAQALDLLRAVDAPLVVLLDWMMPVLNGLEVLDAAVQEPASLGRHAYIFMSAAFPAGLREVAAIPRTVHVGVLIKPFTIPLVLEQVEKAVVRLAHTERFDIGRQGGADATAG